MHIYFELPNNYKCFIKSHVTDKNRILIELVLQQFQNTEALKCIVHTTLSFLLHSNCNILIISK